MTVAMVLIQMAKFYDHDISEQALDLYIQVFKPFSFEQVKHAAMSYMADTKNSRFPIPPHKIMDIYKKAQPDDREVGVELARTVYSLVVNRGLNWQDGFWSEHGNYFEGNRGDFKASFKDAFISVTGPIAWNAVQKFGGWERVCDACNNMDQGIFVAQFRDHVQTVMSMSKNGIDVSKLDMPQKKTEHGLISAKNTLLNLIPDSKRNTNQD
jgi:hypothetical protein